MTGTSASSVFGMNASALPELTGPMIAMTLSCSQEAGDVGDRDLGLDLIVEDGDLDLAALIAARVVEFFEADLDAALHARAEVGGGAGQRAIGADLDRGAARAL